MSLQMQDKAEAEVRAFLELYGWALHEPLPDDFLPRSMASGVHVRLSAASMAKDADRRQHHESSAADMLDKLLSDAEKDQVARAALGELIEMLCEDGISIPPSLGKFAADIFRGRSLKSKRGRPKFGNLHRDSIIHECVLIAGEYVRPYYQDDAAMTAAVIVSWCLPDYGLDDDAMGVEGITGVFKKYQPVSSKG